MRRLTIAAMSAVLCLGAGASAGDESRGAARDVFGYWYTPDRDSLVLIADCGDGTPCGTVTWVDPERAKVLVDENNRDETLKGRPIEGITLLAGFEEASKGWRGGEIYNPENGATYRAKLRRTGADTLEVKGCVGPICKGMVWPRAEVEAELAQAGD